MIRRGDHDGVQTKRSFVANLNHKKKGVVYCTRRCTLNGYTPLSNDCALCTFLTRNHNFKHEFYNSLNFKLNLQDFACATSKKKHKIIVCGACVLLHVHTMQSFHFMKVPTKQNIVVRKFS